jgi:hypothetical protein
MTPPRETLHLEPSVQATHPAYSGRRGVAPEDKSALRKAAKVAWNAAPPFPVASDAELWGKALAAALRTNSILDAALTLAQQRVPVFPVSPVGQKKPLNAHGVYSATTDLAVVEREFRRDIEPLIAVPMGRRTGVFAIDVDASPPHAHDGVSAWQALEAKHGVTPTRVHMTSSGGLHLLFRWPPERPVGCTVKGLPKGVECKGKGEGGGIVFPPSARDGKRYDVVSDIDPAHAPDWLLNIVAPVRKTRSEARPITRKLSADGDGSAYGLKALENACGAIANAGPGERDRAVGESVLAIGSLAAGGELDERHALDALKQAGQSNLGADADYCDKIERAFESGKQNPRRAPQGRHPKRRAKHKSTTAEKPKSDFGRLASVGSRPSCPSYPAVSDQPTEEEKSASTFEALQKNIAGLELADEPGTRGILTDALRHGLSDFQIEMLIKGLSKRVGVGIRPVKKLFEVLRAEMAQEEEPSPGEVERSRRENDERRKRAAVERNQSLLRSCGQLALSQTLLAEMEAVVHKLGVVGEGAAIRGAYLTAASRLLRKRAISLLRRGAAAGGKNFLLTATLRLIPSDSVVLMSSGSPMSLIYYGDGDEDALKHKVLYVQEAAILAEKNGVENPLTVMLRLLISEGCIDHLIAIPQAGGSPVSKKIKRNGPVAVIVTSARDNIESEMLTRLLASDADESPEQTKAVVKGLLAEEEEKPESDLAPWLDFQLWLELEAPYEVSVPFGAALYTAYEKRLQAFPNALQLRMRRDISGLVSAIKTSAILHKAQREKDATGRIVAIIDDYRHAYDAFNEGVSSLYGMKTRKEIIAVVRAIEEMGGKIDESLKVTVAALRQQLGINSNKTADDRLMEAVERHAIELDEERSGSGRGSPRYFKLLKEDLLREINSPSSVSSGRGDRMDMRDKTEPSAPVTAAPERKTAGWSVRL